MQQADQVQNAKRFCDAHEAEIVELRTVLQQAGVWLLNRVIANYREVPELTAALKWCELGDIRKAFSLMRPCSQPFSELGLSVPYWDWIDGTGFLDDAAGSRWPYMNEESRARSFQWAKEHAGLVVHRIPVVSALTRDQSVSALTTCNVG